MLNLDLPVIFYLFWFKPECYSSAAFHSSTIALCVFRMTDAEKPVLSYIMAACSGWDQINKCSGQQHLYQVMNPCVNIL